MLSWAASSTPFVAVAHVWCPWSTINNHLVEPPLLEEDLEHQYQWLHGRQGVHEITHKASCHRTICHIKADVKVDVALYLNKLDDGYLGTGNYLQTTQ